jgi:hypothetical protein
VSEIDWEAVCQSGMKMSAEEVARAEADIAADPEAIEARVRLVGALHGVLFDRETQARRDAHVHWLITHRPEIGPGAVGAISPLASPEGYAEAKRLWLEAAARQPADPRVLRNASTFLFFEDGAIAEELIVRGIALAPSPDWHGLLAMIFEARVDAASPSQRYELASLIVAENERALAQLDDIDRRYTHSIDVARWAIEALDLRKARDHATRVLEDTTTLDERRPAYHGPYWANVVLGKVALMENDPARAVTHLLAAAAPGAPFHDLLSIGRPDLALAAALLERGERDAVARYLSALELLWPDKASTLREKRGQVERGEPADLDEIHRRDREHWKMMRAALAARHDKKPG